MVNILLIHFVSLLFNYNIDSNVNRNNLVPSVALDTCAIIKKIRGDFLAINSKLKSFKKKKREVFDMSSEGGEIIGYYDNTFLTKAHSVFYGETGKVETDYYFNKTGLFFQYKKETFYDKPIYVKGFKIKKIEENRFYVYENKLIQWIVNKTLKSKTKVFKETNNAIKEELKDIKEVLSKN
ncbi:hypothetical protein ABIB40_003429 [Pedobacter sp. UYP30]|uniref:hypothetical protein n=1 Tax=Pedobacter sp. UYP30 TaxID=1756400 RepID=UPI0033975261